MSTPFLTKAVKKIGRELSLRFGKRIAYFPSDKKVISFSFDDVPQTAITSGARLLESFGMHGTFYASLGIASSERPVGKIATQDQIFSLAIHGHELACHTYSHIDCAFKKPSYILSDCIRNQNTAKEKADISFQSFAYPFGSFDPASKYAVSKLYYTARTVIHGINTNKIDLLSLKSVDLIEGYGLNYILGWIEKLDRKGGWLIFNTHDVSMAPSKFGCSIDLFKKVLEVISKRNYYVLPVNKAASIAKLNFSYSSTQ